MADKPDQPCDLCGRHGVELTKHHLIPRTRHSNKRNKKLFDRDEVKSRLLWLCEPCHRQVHAVLSTKALAQEFNTLESLAVHPEIRKFVRWVRKRPPDLTVRVRRPRGRRRQS
ncbi:MAG: hypothetical protein ACODAJ_04920 [Planctomycetota bacterium]